MTKAKKTTTFAAALMGAQPEPVQVAKPTAPECMRRGGVEWGRRIADASVALSVVAHEFRTLLANVGHSGPLPEWKELGAVLDAARGRLDPESLVTVPSRDDIARGFIERLDERYMGSDAVPGGFAYAKLVRAAGEVGARRVALIDTAGFVQLCRADENRKEALKELRAEAQRRISNAWRAVTKADKEGEAKRGARATSTLADRIRKAHPADLLDVTKKAGLAPPAELIKARNAYLKALDTYADTVIG
jgi:hypothetical protein